mmetsp:Transcript_14764/g.19616  ORF Transcript_14764/g.19616 Transcript_14764/m.19616 type:complete len:394 (+) Transcript_14764:259-1440(+)
MQTALAKEAALLGLNVNFSHDESKLILHLTPWKVSIDNVSATQQWQKAALSKWEELGRFQFRHAIALPGSACGPKVLRALRSYPVSNSTPCQNPKLTSFERAHVIKYLKLAAQNDFEKAETIYNIFYELDPESLSYRTKLKLFEARCRRARNLLLRKDINGHDASFEAAMFIFDTALKNAPESDEYTWTVAVRALALAPNFASKALELHQSAKRHGIGPLRALASVDTVSALLRADEIDAALALSLDLAREVAEATNDFDNQRITELHTLLPDVFSWCRQALFSHTALNFSAHDEIEHHDFDKFLSPSTIFHKTVEQSPLALALEKATPHTSADEVLEILLTVLDHHKNDQIAPYQRADIEKVLNILQAEARWPDAFDLLILIRDSPPSDDYT